MPPVSMDTTPVAGSESGAAGPEDEGAGGAEDPVAEDAGDDVREVEEPVGSSS